jgi:hypothetical protein
MDGFLTCRLNAEDLEALTILASRLAMTRSDLLRSLIRQVTNKDARDVWLASGVNGVAAPNGNAESHAAVSLRENYRDVTPSLP